jgi:EAL domain-containing protein (putative c-di-GMP-specific phosphodiesterase class I)
MAARSLSKVITMTILVLDRDRERAAGSAAALAPGGNLVLTGSDAALGRIVGRRMALSSLVTEAQIAGPFTFDGLDAVADVRNLGADCSIVVTGDAIADSVASEAIRRGANAVLPRPFDDTHLRPVLGLTETDGDGKVLHIPTIDELIASERLEPMFQPIVDIEGGSGIGFESLARYREHTLPFCDPSFMFEYARLCGRTVELDLACLRRTLAAARHLPRDGKIFVNIHPRVLVDGDRFARTLIEGAAGAGIELTRIVLEITEQERLEASATTLPAVDRLRAAGVTIALDDVGISYSHLDLIARLRPAYLKISHEFGTDFEGDAARCKIIRNIQSLARDFGCEVILEGVETAATAQAAANIGARYAQGFFYARPA